MNISKIVNDTSIKLYARARQHLPFMMVCLLVSLCLTSNTWAGGVNYLAGLKENVRATFGAGSDTQYFILLAEGLGGAYAYWKSKSPAVLMGVPILMVFTGWALQ